MPGPFTVQVFIGGQHPCEAWPAESLEGAVRIRGARAREWSRELSSVFDPPIRVIIVNGEGKEICSEEPPRAVKWFGGALPYIGNDEGL